MVRNQQFKFFPRNLHKLLTNLKAIQIIGSGLRELTFEDMKNFPNLKSLWLPLNKIEALSNGIFDRNSKIEKLSFYGNLLKSVEARVLMPLNNLIFVSFERNFCIDRAATEENLSELRNEIAMKCDENEKLNEVNKT